MNAKTFFVELFLAWTHQYRLSNGKREKLVHVNLLEEAHRVALRSYDPRETMVDTVFRELREFGEALIIFDQHISSVSKPAVGNTGTTLLFRQKHADDVRAGANAVILGDREKDHLSRLETGCAVVKAVSSKTPPDS